MKHNLRPRFSPAFFLFGIVNLSHFANTMAFVGSPVKMATMDNLLKQKVYVSRCRSPVCGTQLAANYRSSRLNFGKPHATPQLAALKHKKSKAIQHKINRRTIMASTILASCLFHPAAVLASVPISSNVDLTTSYHLSRILFLRLLAVVYIAAFSVARFQNRGLIGDRGITPARKVLDKAQEQGELKSQQRKDWIKQRDQFTSSKPKHLIPQIIQQYKTKISDSYLMTQFRDKFWYRTNWAGQPLPTLLWFAQDRSKLNPWLDNLANVGLFLSTIMLATGSANVFLILGLYIIQRSLMSVGGVWYGYGWEPQLAELTFHALFLVPLFSMDPFLGLNGTGGPYPVPRVVIWAVRFYLFKIMMGAGLIKVKSLDQKWKPGNMSAMYYFYETQPIPNPFTRYFHSMPKPWHKFEVWSNHFVELVAPFMLLSPLRNLRLAGGLIQIIFQLVLISSGNLSFLNWLTIIIGIAFAILMTKLNIPVVRNLLARRQIMNGSFDKLRLANTYGAFGTVSEERIELIIESACNVSGPWKEYEFKAKPGNVYRRPPWISPYHHRLDWQMWIASLGNVERSPWIFSFLLKLLNGEKDVVDLIDHDPWKRHGTYTERPKYIRIEKYRYKFFKAESEDCPNEQFKPYWSRERVGRCFPRQGVMTADMLNEMIGA